MFSAQAQPSRQKLKIPTKRAAHLLQQLNEEKVNEYCDKFPNFRAGDAIEVKIMQNLTSKSIQTVKGVVLGRRNRGLSSTFTLRNHIAGVGFERTIQLYSPMVQSIEVLQEAYIHKGRKRVRRSKLYYLRDKPSKLTTV